MTQTQETPKAQDLAAQLGVVKDDLVRLAGMVGAIAKEKASQAGDTASRFATDAREHASEAYAQTEEKVRQNPALAVGIAAGVGFAVARVIARRRS